MTCSKNRTRFRLPARFRTFLRRHFDCSEFSLKSGWNSVERFGARILMLSAFLLVASCWMSIWSPSQTPLQFQTQRIDKLEALVGAVPAQIVALQVKLDLKLDQQSKDIESMSNRAWVFIVGFIMFAARELFREFGGKTSRRREPLKDEDCHKEDDPKPCDPTPVPASAQGRWHGGTSFGCASPRLTPQRQLIPLHNVAARSEAGITNSGKSTLHKGRENAARFAPAFP